MQSITLTLDQLIVIYESAFTKGFNLTALYGTEIPEVYKHDMLLDLKVEMKKDLMLEERVTMVSGLTNF